MRARGLAGHWTYDKGLHSNLLTILAAERAALAASHNARRPPLTGSMRGLCLGARIAALVGGCAR
jgi:hypothetical protein